MDINQLQEDLRHINSKLKSEQRGTENYKFFLRLQKIFTEKINKKRNKKKKITFTHLWVTGFGWENTVYLQNDFKKIEFIAEREDYIIYVATQKNYKQRILRGYKQPKPE